jgi:hypothetical protein
LIAGLTNISTDGLIAGLTSGLIVGLTNGFTADVGGESGDRGVAGILPGVLSFEPPAQKTAFEVLKRSFFLGFSG